jgi:cytosine/adenosine deaminase-related metal-dependent hydrolase
VDWSHIQNTPEHTDEAVRALREAGGRAVFAYGFPNTGPEWFYESARDHPSDARRVRSEHFSSDDGLVTMAMALRGPELSNMEVTERDWALARELGLRVTVHVGNGAFGVPYRAIEKLYEAGLMDPGTQYAHNTSLTDEALGLVRESEGTTVVTPAVEMQMGFGMPATGRLLRAGLRPGLGIDVVTSTGSDLFTQMRAALQAQRALALAGNEDTPVVTTRDVLGFATIEGARSVGLGAKTGSLTPGKEADVVVLRADALGLTPQNDSVGTVVLAAHPGLVDSVFVVGRALKRDGALVGVDVERVQRLAAESRDRLFAKAGVGIGTS